MYLLTRAENEEVRRAIYGNLGDALKAFNQQCKTLINQGYVCDTASVDCYLAYTKVNDYIKSGRNGVRLKIESVPFIK